jgi:hypothetical protein
MGERLAGRDGKTAAIDAVATLAHGAARQR